MFNGNAMPSLADIAAVTGNGRNNDGMWGGDGWWAIIIFAMIFGWGGFGGNGWGGNGGMGATASAYTDSAIQRGFDTQAIIGKLDGITNGLCDGFYAQNTAVMNGFHGVDNAICNLGYQTQQGFNTTNVTLMQAQNALQSQLANCCCETREAIQGVNYNMAQNTCALQNTMNSNTRDIIDNQNNNARAILDALTAQRIEAKDTKIAEQNQQLFAAQLAASQASQNETLKAYMQGQFTYYNPRPVPAFPVSAPYQYGNCGCNTGCGC